jgi:hypothetical protein
MFRLFTYGKCTRINTIPFCSCYSIFSFMYMFCRSLFFALSFLFWPLCCLPYFDWWIIPLWYLQTLLRGNGGFSNQRRRGMTQFAALIPAIFCILGLMFINKWFVFLWVAILQTILFTSKQTTITRNETWGWGGDSMF